MSGVARGSGGEVVPIEVASSGAAATAGRPGLAPEALSTPALLKAITQDVEHLVKTQIALAKAEVRADLSDEKMMVAGLGVSAVAGLLALNLLLVTVVLALASVMPAWLAGLAVSGGALLVAVVAGVMGWAKRVRRPLEHTRHEIEEDLKWTKKPTV